jgi:hypothetical protein
LITLVRILAGAALLTAVTAHAVAPGLPFLVMGTSARGGALAESMTAVSDPEAGSANPAALSAPGRGGAWLTHSAWVQGLDQEALCVVAPRGRLTIGLAAQLAQADDLQRRRGPSVEPLGSFGVYDATVGVLAACTARHGLRLGAGFRYLHQTVADQSAHGAAIDLGAWYPVSPRLSLGAAWRNLGRMNDLNQTATPLPRSLRLGLAYRVAPALLVTAETQHTRGPGLSGHAGVEVSVRPHLPLRLGYQTGDNRGLSAGVGLAARHWSVDYAYLPFGSGLGEAHRLGIHYLR